MSFFAVCKEQHNLPQLVQDETVHNIRCATHGLRGDNECGKLQVITVFIEIGICRIVSNVDCIFV